MHEFARLRTRRFALSLILHGFPDGLLSGHGALPS
jgi:hypothetical protein